MHHPSHPRPPTLPLRAPAVREALPTPDQRGNGEHTDQQFWLKDDVSPADWIIDQIHDFAVDVGSVIPEGFEAYARLFHPAVRIEDGEEMTVNGQRLRPPTGQRSIPGCRWYGISGAWEDSGAAALMGSTWLIGQLAMGRPSL